VVAQQGRNVLKGEVAGCVSVQVVDALELVQVQQQGHQHFSVPPRAARA